MNNNDVNKLDLLYARYGYVLKNQFSDSKIRVYTLNKGVYFGADIIFTNSSEIIEKAEAIQGELSKAGFGCRKIVFENTKEIEDSLFKVFFKPDALKQRLKDRYNKFIYNQSLLLGGDVGYEYINAPYVLDGSIVNNQNIIEAVMAMLSTEGASLIIIEASAGFGKTCTSYELIKHLSDKSHNMSPIFTELSRDRRAAIFKHILDDVIINEFHSLLDEKLVVNEIKSGNIPLIIDGFDELLSKEQDLGSDDFQQVETMLSTIGELLERNSKIILTGRKTAIFSGDSFQDWVDNSPNDFNVSRFLLNPPRIKDWLTASQLEKIDSKQIPIREIANPVLLAFIRRSNDTIFDTIISNPSDLVDKYFNAILEREQERQDLRIEPSQQLIIFERLTKRMVDFDITSDTKEWIRLLIEEQNRTYLEEVRKSYSAAQRPSIDEMTNTLSNHALLDRKGNNDNIGFINDFIFGTLIGRVLIKTESDWNKDVSKHMFELASTAFQFQNREHKESLLKIILSIIFFSPQEKLIHEYLLSDKILSNFKEATFSDLTLANLFFEKQSQFDSCVFANCFFNKCSFSIPSFKNTSFVNCIFKNCNLTSVDTYNRDDITIINCNDYDSAFIQSIDELNIATFSITNNQDDNYMLKEILSKYFKKGGFSPRFRRMSLLISEFPVEKRAVVTSILKDLQTKSLLKTNGDNSFLTDEGIRLGQENKPLI